MDKAYWELGIGSPRDDDDLASQSFFGFTRSALAAFDYHHAHCRAWFARDIDSKLAFHGFAFNPCRCLSKWPKSIVQPTRVVY